VDFGFAGEYMEAAWNIMQLDEPDDFIICTGETHSIQELLELAFSYVGLDPEKYSEFNKTLLRPSKTDTLIGDYSKAKKAFGFEPKVRFKELVKMLVDHDKQTISHP